jgi:hypothetical protein
MLMCGNEVIIGKKTFGRNLRETSVSAKGLAIHAKPGAGSRRSQLGDGLGNEYDAIVRAPAQADWGKPAAAQSNAGPEAHRRHKR